MKKIISGFLFLVLAICSNTAVAQALITPDTSSPTDRDRFVELTNLQDGPIKSFQESTADIALKFGEPAVTNERLQRNIRFDFIGKEIANSHFDDNGTLTEQQAYTRETNSEKTLHFDGDGNLAHRFMTDYNQYGDKRIWTRFEADSDAFTWQYTYVYDAEGLPLNVTKYFPDGSVDVLASFTYDGEGNKLTEAVYKSDGEFLKLEQFTYENNLLVQEDTFDSNNTLSARATYTHDDDGNVLSISNFDSNKALRFAVKYAYDDNNNRIKEQELNAEGELTQQTNFSFDKEGNKLSETLYDSEGTQLLQQILEYNATNQLLKKFYYNTDQTIDRGFEYSYDATGNLLETKNIIFGGAHFSTDVCEYKQIDSYGNWTERNCVLFKRVSGQFQADYGDSISEVTLREIEYFE